MGLLADIYSAGDGLKRKVGGLLSDPMGTIDLAVSRIKEDNNNALNLFSNAFPMAGENTVLNSPEQIAQLQKQAAEYASQVGMAAATVWHGSPHKFDKFDSSKIGTGEGAQAYGHGLYLAESPDVAKQYSKLGEIASINGMPIAGPKKAVNPDSAKALGVQPTTLDWLGNNGWNVKQAMDAAGAEAQAASTIGDKAFYHQITGDLKRLMKSDVDVGAGQVYKVDLPDEHIAKMLDWDKPLSQQHPDTAMALEALRESARKSFPAIADGDPTGRGIYSAYQAHRGGNQSAASDKLRELGIPGIRYLDGGSRGAGQGSSNFVVFPGNEGLLSILERNGQALK